MSKFKNVRRTLTAVLMAALASSAMAVAAAPASAALGITLWDGEALQLNGEPMTQAGSHPFRASTTFKVTEAPASDGQEYPTESFEDVIVDLPPGLVGNPNGVPTCTEPEIAVNGSQPVCPLGSQIGTLKLFHDNTSRKEEFYVPVFNMPAPKGAAALLGFNYASAIYHIRADLVRDDGVAGHYRVRVSSLDTPMALNLAGAKVLVWGIPADPNLNSDRGWRQEENSPILPEAGTSCETPLQPPVCNFPSPEPRKPFFTLPTSCEGPAQTDLAITGWQGGKDSASFLSHDNTLPTPNPIGNDGCNTLDFSPTVEARPTTNVADSPSGLEVKLHVPQNEDPDGTATAHLRDTTVVLPEGMAINPAGANGLGACTPAELGLHSDEPAQCPDSAKVGIVEVETPLLDHPVPGSVYVASPYDNPFGSLLAIYIVLDDSVTGTVVKLAGEVELDPRTGQLTATVEENPQLPFEDFRLRFFGGAGGPLRTPATCGTYTTTTSMTPWSAPESGPPATPSDSWAIEQAPDGSTCPSAKAQQPHAPKFDGGTVSPIAGAYSPLVLNLRREDGSQELWSVTVTPPPGLVGKLAGIPYCPDSALAAAAAKTGKQEQASPSCPAASAIGSVTAGAGAGPTPYYAPGTAYLTGPYKGAPLSLAIVTPAVAGPFDLGTVVVRSALHVDPTTAQITAVSDPLPTILQGVPLDIRSVQVKLDRPDFTLNPTSCDPMALSGQLLSTLGQPASLQSRFQVAECGRLAFKPKLGLRLKGGTKRNGHPALEATLRFPEGANANVAKASVALPHSEFLDQSHIRTICTRVQFAADACPRGAIYGSATAVSPLLDAPLQGPVYLRSSSNELPDLVADLRGQVDVTLVGRIDSVNGGIRTTFESAPDAPVSSFVLQMQGGKKGLLVNSRDICFRSSRATARFEGHNGKVFSSRPPLRAQCGKSKGGKKRAGKRSER